MQFEDLQQLSDQGSLYAYLCQRLMGDRLDDELGEYSWSVDMSARRLWFYAADAAKGIECGIELVATMAPGPRSLLWGWAHPQTSGEFVAGLREYGERHGIASLTAPELSLPTSATGPEYVDEIAEAAHTVGQVAVAVLGRAPYYSAPAEGGTRAVLLLSDHPFETPRIDARLPLRLPDGLQAASARDHRTAVHWLGVRSGWEVSWTPDWSQADLRDPVTGNAATCQFNAAARLVDLSAHLGRMAPS